MTLFGGIMLGVCVICAGGLILHYRVMKLRTRLDMAIIALEEAPDGDIPPDLQEEYAAALADYEEYTSRFPGNLVARILQLP